MKRWHIVYAHRNNHRFWLCKDCGKTRGDCERLPYAEGKAIVDSVGSTCDKCGSLLRYSYEDVPDGN